LEFLAGLFFLEATFSVVKEKFGQAFFVARFWSLFCLKEKLWTEKEFGCHERGRVAATETQKRWGEVSCGWFILIVQQALVET